ncbi:hypothetical protein D3C80_1059550 [compost metagenome]
MMRVNHLAFTSQRIAARKIILVKLDIVKMEIAAPIMAEPEITPLVMCDDSCSERVKKITHNENQANNHPII